MDISTFAREHVYQISATIGLVTFALLANKLTTGGIVAGIFVAIVHMLHPWPAIFWLLIVFFVFGTAVTKAGSEIKSGLTQSSTGGSGGEGARTSAQVLANSGMASILIALHTYLLNSTPFISSTLPIFPGVYAPTLQRVLPIGIIAQYAAVTADTFSSELGILAPGTTVLITNPWKEVPKGTNGGVTLDGLLSGAFGAFGFTMVATVLLDKYSPVPGMTMSSFEVVFFLGAIGSAIDSLLGALLQATVTDKASGKVVEGHGGQRVKVTKGGSRVQVGGLDLLTNNGVNFVMAASISLLAVGIAWFFEIEL